MAFMYFYWKIKKTHMSKHFYIVLLFSQLLFEKCQYSLISSKPGVHHNTYEWVFHLFSMNSSQDNLIYQPYLLWTTHVLMIVKSSDYFLKTLELHLTLSQNQMQSTREQWFYNICIFIPLSQLYKYKKDFCFHDTFLKEICQR